MKHVFSKSNSIQMIILFTNKIIILNLNYKINKIKTF